MSRPVPSSVAAGVAARLASFVLERFPFALQVVQEALESCGASRIAECDGAHVEFLRIEFKGGLKRALEETAAAGLPDPPPGVADGRRAARDSSRPR